MSKYYYGFISFRLTIQITSFLSYFDSSLETEGKDSIWPKTKTKKPDSPKDKEGWAMMAFTRPLPK